VACAICTYGYFEKIPSYIADLSRRAAQALHARPGEECESVQRRIKAIDTLVDSVDTRRELM